jgi:hypothetical protein
MLIQTLREDTEENNRLRAAEELRDYDPKVFPDILPALTEALANDPSFKVRAEAAESLGKINLVSPKAGYALEQALKFDSAKAVRDASRSALLQYRVRGYRSGKENDTTATQTEEPPLARPSTSPMAPGTSAVRPPVQATPIGLPKGSVVIGGRVQTPEPPLAKPPVTEVSTAKPAAPVVPQSRPDVPQPPMIPLDPMVPSVPSVPMVPTVPSAPVVTPPSTPTIPSTLPTVPAVPSIPASPTVPAAPSTPASAPMAPAAPVGPSLQGPALGVPSK